MGWAGSPFIEILRDADPFDRLSGAKMVARLGEVLFWACIILAGLWLYAVYGPGGGPKVDVTG